MTFILLLHRVLCRIIKKLPYFTICFFSRGLTGINPLWNGSFEGFRGFFPFVITCIFVTLSLHACLFSLRFMHKGYSHWLLIEYYSCMWFLLQDWTLYGIQLILFETGFLNWMTWLIRFLLIAISLRHQGLLLHWVW